MFSKRKFVNYQVKLHHIRRRIFWMVIGLSFFGLMLVYDASSAFAFRNYGDAMFFLKRQALFVFIGILCLIGVLNINLERMRKHSRVLLLIGIVFLITVLFLGVTCGGAKRWFRFCGIGFQPSEIMKVFFLVYLSDYFYRKRNKMRDLLKGILPILLVTGLTSFLIFLEPDFGTAMLFGLMLFLFMFIGRVPKRYLISLVVSAFLVFSVLVFSSPYRRQRLFTYVNPWVESQGSGFQLVQSQIGVGSGGLFGVGLGESRQKLFFLPAAHTDFIYSLVAEELGFFGAITVLLVYLFIFFQGVRALNWVNDGFRFYLGWGIMVMFIVQALINISVSIGIFPTKGFPLPFLSYGGSSTVVSFILIGIFLNATKTDYKDLIPD